MFRNVMATLLLSLLPVASGNAQAELVTDPYEAEGISCVQAEEWRSTKRYRLIADFNGDNLPDVAISYSVSLFGNAGGHANIYLARENGDYKKVGNIFFHPAAIALATTVKKGAVIVVYYRENGTYGAFVQFKVSENGVSKISEERINTKTPQGISQYEAKFMGAPGILIEYSDCSTGEVVWKAI